MKINTNPLQSRRLIIMTLFAFLLVYVIIRAYILTFTHDESLSFTIVEGSDNWKYTANNHLLNTFLMSWSNSLFGNSEFSLRLPNVLAFILYLTGCFYLFKTTKSNWLLFFGLTMVLLNPFLIEFFSLARGYGLSLAFMMISIFFLLRNGNHYTSFSLLIKDLAFASLFASLALYANLGMINFYISLLIVFMLKYVVFKWKQGKNLRSDLQFAGVLIASFIPIYWGMSRLLQLKAAEQLYYGEHSIMKGADSLINASMYVLEDNVVMIAIVKIVVVLFLFAGVFYIIRQKKYDGPLFVISLLIMFLTLGLFLEHHLFGAKYPVERTALFFIPILALFIYHLLLDVESTLPKKYMLTLIVCLTVPMCINFIAGSNFTHTKTWSYDKHTKDAVTLIEEKSKGFNKKVSIGNYWLSEPALNYYIKRWRLNIQPAKRDELDVSADFIYLLEDTTLHDNYRVLRSYEDIQSRLLIKKEVVE